MIIELSEHTKAMNNLFLRVYGDRDVLGGWAPFVFVPWLLLQMGTHYLIMAMIYLWKALCYMRFIPVLLFIIFYPFWTERYLLWGIARASTGCLCWRLWNCDSVLTAFKVNTACGETVQCSMLYL